MLRAIIFLRRSDAFLRIAAGALLLTAIFPYFSPIRTPFDTQPWTLIVAAIALLVLYDGSRPFGAYFLLAGYAALVLLVGLVHETSRLQEGLRSLVVYVSIAVIAWAASRLFRHFPARLFLAGAGVWLLVTVIQMSIDPYFLTRLLPRAYDFGFVGRGYMSLAPEPSYFVKAMIAFLVLNEFFYKDRRYGRSAYLAVTAAIVFQVVAAKAGVSIVYLGVAAAAKAVSIVWEKEGKEKIVAGAAALLLAAGFAAFFVVPEIRASRGGSFAARIETAISSPSVQAVEPPKAPEISQARGRTTARYNPAPKNPAPKNPAPKAGVSPLEKVLKKLSVLYRKDQSTSTRVGNLIWSLYGGLIETKGAGFGMGTDAWGQVPPWMLKYVGVNRPWGGRNGGGFVQGVYELGAVGLVFLIGPLWLIAGNLRRERAFRGPAWMTLALIYPAAAISESAAFPLLGILLGIHGFLRLKRRESSVPSEGKNFLVLNQYYPPDIASTGQYAADICSGLVRAGYGVHVIAAQPSYAASSTDAPPEEVRDGIHIHRVPMPGARGRERMLVRVLGYAGFLLQARSRARGLARTGAFGTVVTFHNPPFLGLIGAGLVPLRSGRFVFVSYDVHPDALLVAGWKVPRPLVALWDRLNHRIYGKAGTIVVLVEGAKRILREKKGVPEEKIAIVPLWGKPELEPIPPDPEIRNELGVPADGLILLYAGNMGIMHPLESILEAAAELKDEDVHFLFLGEGVKRKSLSSRAEAGGLTKVRFLPYQPEDRFIRILSASDACFVSFGPGMEEITIPSRTYTFLSAGKPLVTIMSPEAEVARLAVDRACGWNVASGKELAALARLLVKERNLLGPAARNARAAYIRDFRKDVILDRYVRLIAGGGN
jgi:colanic acid biosynthesis glycosyl transferase WcaI